MFTVNKSGIYLVSYHVNTTAALLMGTRLMINNSSFIDSVIAPVASTSSFESRIQHTLPVGSTISLQLFTRLADAAILMGDGVGASLSIIRLGD